MSRPTFAYVDPSAIAHNVKVIGDQVAPAAVCAVVKADAYGHGAIVGARAALAGGASMLAVALVEEAAELRQAAIDAPILLLSECRPAEMKDAYSLGLVPTVYSIEGIAAAADAAQAAGAAEAAGAATSAGTRWPVHLKVDTGMHRVGASPSEIVARAQQIADVPSLALGALWTHCAVADDPDDEFTAVQLDRFDAAVDALRAHGINPPLLHVANSGGALLHPRSRYGMVRCGISMYGCPPASGQREIAAQLRPAMRLASQVTHVQTVDVGEGVSYGRRWRATRPTRVGTVPIGYADGVRREYGMVGGRVLVRGQRCNIIGVITMDQLMFDCGNLEVSVGDEVVLIGTQGAESISADEIADRLGTISYEVLCDIGRRVPRVVAGGEP